jgi:tRNA(fMet)-specific endonuclease VapC
MQYIVLDTCAIIHLLRGNKSGIEIKDWIESLNPQPRQIISVVTKAELMTFVKINKWGEKTLSALHEFIMGITTIDINRSDAQLLQNYILIDTYSKNSGVDENGNSKEGSHIKMGKNDLWIGATAKAINATLVTCDGDFDHLPESILKIKKFNYKKINTI